MVGVMAHPGLESDEARILLLMREWRDLSEEAAAWHAQLEHMRAEMTDLRERGLWRSGGRTLLRALWLQHDEVILCRGLAWLLQTDGWHGLGPSYLRRLLDHLGIEHDELSQVEVVTEEARGDTRADIVVRFGQSTLLVEAKVWAGEQHQQADRLADGWQDENPYLVFLTRDGRPPTSAINSAGSWHGISWAELAVLLEEAVGERPDCAPGVREYLQTLITYGGSSG